MDPRRLFVFDEFGFHLGMTRLYARAPTSERAYGKVPGRVGSNITLMLGVSLQGIVAPFAFVGAMNAHTFTGYMIDQVIPLLPPDAIVVVDNLSAHYAEEVGEELDERGIELWFLPPYSPELSPAEECGSKVKAITRAIGPRTQSDLIEAMGHAIGKVTPQDLQGWFAHARRDRAPRPHPKGAFRRDPTSDQPQAADSG